MKYSKIILIGMMGSGKSSIGCKLSEKINLPFFDTDEIFTIEEKISIKDYFKIHGEEKFRIKETQILKKITEFKNYIISTGGGIVLKEENRKILFNKQNLTIYLNTKPNTIFERIKNDTQRPLLLVENPLEEIESILKNREKLYNLAKYKIKTDNKTIEEIIKEIEDILCNK